MKLTRIITIGLILTAFLFNPWLNWDVREIKMVCAVIFGLFIIGIQLYRKGLAPIDNKWLMMLLAYLPISMMFIKPIEVTVFGQNVSDFWFWKPFSYFLIFTLMALAIASHDFTKKEIRKIFNVISICGFITASYVIIQRIGADQFFYSTAPDTGPYAGFIGNPTLTAHYIAMTIPFTFYMKRWYFLPFIAIALIIADSLVAGGGLLGGVAFLLASNMKRVMVIGSIALAFGLIILFLYPQHIQGREHERFDRWKQVVKDIKKPSFITGRGLGSFSYFFQAENPGEGNKPNRFKQAHNDYLEWFYGVGLVGFILSILAFFKFIKGCILSRIQEVRIMLSSLVMILITSQACFDLQIGTMAFLTALICGLLMNKRVLCQS